MKFAIDLTGLGVKIESGLGNYICNILKGILQSTDSLDVYLITSYQNSHLFEFCSFDKRFHFEETTCPALPKFNRIYWVNVHLNALLKKLGITVCFEPFYCMPILNTQKIRYVTTIHDLQACHYPEFQNFLRNIWQRFMWSYVSKHADKVVTISNFCVKDILEKYSVRREKLICIYNPSLVDDGEEGLFEEIESKYGINHGEYYYTVSKLRANKNLETLIHVFAKIHNSDQDKLPCRLLISGAGSNVEELKRLIDLLELGEYVTLTGFVDDEERNCLYRHAKAFLFPSVFEGFGMPAVEAMSVGTSVITTKCSCMQEVTQGLANYVDDPYSVDNWIAVMLYADNKSENLNRAVYSTHFAAKRYIEVIEEVYQTANTLN